jgi:hypothetical protein
MSNASSRYVFPGCALSSAAPARIRTGVRVRYEPALLPGPLTPARECSRALGRLAREVARCFGEAKRGQIHFLQR